MSDPILPYPEITPIPNNEPTASPSLWNARYAQVDENFKALAAAIDLYLAHPDAHPQLQAAVKAAESARDAALIQAGVYVDEPTGRAAVADGQAFKVQGSGDVAAYEYRRIDASKSEPITSYPSKSGVDTADNLRGRFEDFDGTYLLKWLTPLRKRLMAIRQDGTLIAKLGISLGIGNGLTFLRQSDGTYKLGLGVKENVLPVGQAEIDASNELDWLHVIRTPLRKWLFGIRKDGSTQIAKLHHEIMGGMANSSRFFVRVVRDEKGWHYLSVFDRKTGISSSVAKTVGSSKVAPCISGERWLTYSTMKNREVTQEAYDLIDKESVPLESTTSFALWGDSLTAPGSGYGDTFASLMTGYLVSINGIGGQRSFQVAGRQGAVINSYNELTIPSGQIPASGSVACNPNYMYSGPPGGTNSARISVAGITGILTTSVSSGGAVTTTFSRDVEGPAVNVTNPVKFSPESGLGNQYTPLKDLRRRITFIYIGANDVGKSDYSQEFVLSQIDAMVSNLRAVCAKYLVLGATNAWGNLPVSQGGTRSDDATSQKYMDQIEALNAALKSKYDSLFFDTHAELAVTPGYSNTYTVLGKNYSVLTNVVSNDGVHYTTVGKNVIANGLKTVLNNKGWIV